MLIEQQKSVLYTLLKSIWQTRYEALTFLGKGEYGQCYGVTLAAPPYRAVVKMYTYPGTGYQEARQLKELRIHATVPVPQIYAYLPETELGELLVMEWLSGESCPRPEKHSYLLRKSLQQQVVDLLLNLHAVEHPQGYGTFDGPWYPGWWDYFGARVYLTHRTITSNQEACTYFGPQVLALMDRCLEYGERIVSTAQSKPVLLHGDFCYNNLLFHPQPWQLSGLLDPLDAEWGDRELDLVNIINGHIHHFELLNRYRESVDLNPRFPLRYWFYQVQKWLFYYVRVGVPCREWVLRCGRELEKAIQKYL